MSKETEDFYISSRIAAKMLKMGVSNIRKQAARYQGKKICGSWYFPESLIKKLAGK